MNWKQILALLARLAALALIVEGGTIWVCARWLWTPIQRHYLAPYVWSSLPLVAPSAIDVPLIWKTRPRGKPELASGDDTVSSEDGTGLALSQWARDAGWTQLIEGPEQPVPTSILGPGLADLAFDGESLWDFLFLPEAGSLTVFCLSLFGWYCLKRVCQDLMAEVAWRRRVAACETPSPILLPESRMLPGSVCSRLRALHQRVPRRIPMHISAPSADIRFLEPAPKPESFAFPVFGIYNGTAADGYLWREKDDIV